MSTKDKEASTLTEGSTQGIKTETRTSKETGDGQPSTKQEGIDFTKKEELTFTKRKSKIQEKYLPIIEDMERRHLQVNKLEEYPAKELFILVAENQQRKIDEGVGFLSEEVEEFLIYFLKAKMNDPEIARMDKALFDTARQAPYIREIYLVLCFNATTILLNAERIYHCIKALTDRLFNEKYLGTLPKDSPLYARFKEGIEESDSKETIKEAIEEEYQSILNLQTDLYSVMGGGKALIELVEKEARDYGLENTLSSAYQGNIDCIKIARTLVNERLETLLTGALKELEEYGEKLLSPISVEQIKDFPNYSTLELTDKAKAWGLDQYNTVLL